MSKINYKAFIEDNFDIIDKKGQRVHFILNNIQNKILEELSGRDIILKARQEGVSSLILAIFTVDFILLDNSKSICISHEHGMTQKLFDRVKFFIRSFEEKNGFKLPLRYNSRTEMVNEANNAYFYIGAAGAREFGRGETLTNVHFSEFARYPDPEKIYLSASQAGNPKLIVIETTANGIGDFFYQMWCDAQERKNNYKPHFFGWQHHQEYRLQVPDSWQLNLEEQDLMNRYQLTKEQLAWRREKMKEFMTEDSFRQEYPLCVGGKTWISDEGVFRAEDAPNKIDNGIQKLFIISTQSGRQLEATEYHQIFNGVEYKKVKDLLSGDTIALLPPKFNKKIVKVPINLLLPGVKTEVKIDRDWARFLGIYMGDGSIYGGNGQAYVLSIVCDKKDEAVISEVKRLFQKLFGNYHERIVGSKRGGVEVRVHNKHLKELFLNLGIAYENSSGKIKRKVCVPDYIVESPSYIIKEFLRGVFESDGFVGFGQPRIVLFSKHEQFLRDIQYLLLGFNITSTIRIADKKAGDGHRYTGRELHLKAAETKKFLKEIGFISQRKSQRLFSFPRKGWNYNKIEFKDTIKIIQYKGEEKVYNLTTSKGYYSANGIWTHNSPEEAFISSGRPVFNTSALQWYRENKEMVCRPLKVGNLVGSKPPVFEEGIEGYLKIWKMPEPEGQYVIGADPCEGVSQGDFACAQVLDRRRFEQVAVWHGHADPDVFAKELIKLGYFYNTAWIAPERNNQGIATILTMRDLYYPSIWMRERVGELADRLTPELGWVTDMKTKPLMIADLAEAIRDKNIIIHDEQTVNELFSYQYDEAGHANAAKGAYDDRVTSLAIAVQLYKRVPLDKESENVITKEEGQEGITGPQDMVQPGMGPEEYF